LVAALSPPGAEALQRACYLAYLGALAAAAADTWATELGTRYGGAPWSLRSFSRVSPGASGAVSLVGTGAAVLGAASVAGAATLVPGPVGTGELVGSAVGAGVAGMAVDTLAGATIESPRGRNDGDQEWDGIDNDGVNLLGTTTGAVSAVLLGMLG
jgi:uncharacterized protein (TIGR00297 family)